MNPSTASALSAIDMLSAETAKIAREIESGSAVINNNETDDIDEASEEICEAAPLLLQDSFEDSQDEEEGLLNTSSVKEAESRRASISVLFWLLFWLVNNIVLTLLNKATFARFDFSYPFFLSFFHMLCNYIGAEVCFRLLELTQSSGNNFPNKLFNQTKYLRVGQSLSASPLLESMKKSELDTSGKIKIYAFSVLFSLNIAIGNVSLRYVSVNFNQVMRSLVPAMAIALGFCLGKKTSRQRCYAVVPIVVGVAMACFGDFSITAIGFVFTVLCVVLSALKTVAAGEILTGELKLHPIDLLYKLAPKAALQCLILSLFTGEVVSIASRWSTELSPFVSMWPLFGVVSTGLLSFSLNIASLMSNKLTSPLSLCIAANVKQVLMIVMATYMFNTEVSPLNMAGIVVVLIGSAVYSLISVQEKTGGNCKSVETDTKQLRECLMRRTRIKFHFALLLIFLAGQGVWIYQNRSSTSLFQGGKIKKDNDSASKIAETELEPVKETIQQHTIPNEVHNEFVTWSNKLHSSLGMDMYDAGVPKVNWSWHARDRVDRFPSVEERIKYYMGKWYDETKPLYGMQFRQDLWVEKRGTRRFGIDANVNVDLYDLNPNALIHCDAEANGVFHAYCRDYVDLAILHTSASSHVVTHIGDGMPIDAATVLEEYPFFNKVRFHCDPQYWKELGEDENPHCAAERYMEPIVWPLNRHRHLFPPVTVPWKDIPFEDKIAKAIWRGGSNEQQKSAMGSDESTKWNLVSRHVNSTLVDAKFAFRKILARYDFIPREYIGSYIDKDEQLSHKYLISIEGNDVSSGLKWMLFSNSLVLLTPMSFESWAMEGLLKPYVHYIPIKPDASDVEEKVQWAEDNPDQVKKIIEASTLFIYDLLFHPDALKDEQDIQEGIMKRFETNFGYAPMQPSLHPLTHIHADWHPTKRSDRLPSVDERVRFRLGKWADELVLMDRDDERVAKLFNLTSDSFPMMDGEFVASRKWLGECAKRSGRYGDELQQYCKEAIPYFDEKLVFDLKRPGLKTAKESNLKFVGKRGQKVLLDDAVKVLRFGDSPSKLTEFPVFAKVRNNVEDSATILWQFDYRKELRLVESGLVEKLDMAFFKKQPRAIWRGGFGTGDPFVASPMEFKNRQELVKEAAAHPTYLDAAFVLSEERGREAGTGEAIPSGHIISEPQNERDAKEFLASMLSFRYIVATEDDFRSNSSLKWMLLSQSVVLMPENLKFATWFMENSLQPNVHFVPIHQDYSNVKEQVMWCEANLETCQRISERATLYVHDLLFDAASELETAEVQHRVMDRYAEMRMA